MISTSFRTYIKGVTEEINVIQDRRIKRTQQLLARALIALTLEKGYEAVTIRDITERAEIGYATFFRHYRAKDELLQVVLDVVVTELVDLMHPVEFGTDPKTMGVVIFRYVQEHNEMVRVLLNSHALLEKTIETVTQDILRERTPVPDSPIPAEIAANHIVTSSIALIRWWLEHQMPYPPERMGIIYYELIMRPTSIVAFSV
jgi:AcrR family transcriptional regulator